MISRTALILLLAAPFGSLPALAQEAPNPALVDITSLNSLQALKARQFEPGTEKFNQLGFATPQPAATTPTGFSSSAQLAPRRVFDYTIQRPRNRRSY